MDEQDKTIDELKNQMKIKISAMLPMVEVGLEMRSTVAKSCFDKLKAQSFTEDQALELTKGFMARFDEMIRDRD